VASEMPVDLLEQPRQRIRLRKVKIACFAKGKGADS
jgi:hypothetical protein